MKIEFKSSDDDTIHTLSINDIPLKCRWSTEAVYMLTVIDELVDLITYEAHAALDRKPTIEDIAEIRAALTAYYRGICA